MAIIERGFDFKEENKNKSGAEAPLMFFDT
jgi:hypothetical protein